MWKWAGSVTSVRHWSVLTSSVMTVSGMACSSLFSITMHTLSSTRLTHTPKYAISTVCWSPTWPTHHTRRWQCPSAHRIQRAQAARSPSQAFLIILPQRDPSSLRVVCFEVGRRLHNASINSLCKWFDACPPWRRGRRRGWPCTSRRAARGRTPGWPCGPRGRTGRS